MRARMALYYAGIAVEIREVLLRDMPPGLISRSAKATVPVLILVDNTVIDESWDIVKWALGQHDPDNWSGQGDRLLAKASKLIERNDTNFKCYLDRYKYADRYPEHPRAYHRSECEAFLQELEQHLTVNNYLLGDSVCAADIGIFPFVRQFAYVDYDWFGNTPYDRLKRWLTRLLDSDLFNAVMDKYPAWEANAKPYILARTSRQFKTV